MALTCVYKLEKIYDDPAYQGFAFAEDESLLGNRTVYDDFWPASRE